MNAILALELEIEELKQIQNKWKKENEWIAKGIELAICNITNDINELKILAYNSKKDEEMDALIRNYKIKDEETVVELKHYFTGGLTHCKGVENGEKKENS